MDQAKLAGRFAKLQQSDLFQESIEGLVIGGTAGATLLGTDTPLPEIALQTAGTLAAGGLGIKNEKDKQLETYQKLYGELPV
jgi:hypothetical protein